MKAITQRPPAVRLLFEPELIIDGFAGGGGASTGLEMALGRSPDIAINHDREALAMHKVNHPRTRHIRSNIRKVRYGRLVRGRRVACGWFSPDCTYFSKARGKKPFRDRNKARRIRGLAWEMLRFALEVKKTTGEYPRCLFMENVEEIQDWCPIGHDGQPDWSKRGKNFKAWVARWKNLGAAIEWKELRAMWYGAPTSRKRLFVIVRFDGQPIVWPEATHGKGLQSYRTAAECIDFSLPVPSIFLTKKEATAWGKAHGVAKPKRPLATPSLRRVARGVMRFVVNNPQPFIVSVRHQDESHVHSVHEPIRTIPASDREFAVIQPVLAPFFAGVGGRKGQSPETAVTRPYHTITAKGDTVLVAPSLVRLAHGERDANGKKRGKGEHPVTESLPTQPCSNEFALVAPTLIQVGYGERDGQAPRVLDLHQPLGTIVGQGMKHALVAALIAKHNGGWDNRSGYKPDEPLHTIVAHGGQQQLVAAFLAKHNGGHEATGQLLTQPADTIVCRENKALVTSHLVKFKGTCRDGQPVTEPIHTVQAHGNHYAEVRVEAHALKDDRIPPSAYKVYAFLMKYYGTKKDGITLRGPLDTVTTKDRFALVTVTVDGETYVIVDIGMRMLTPRELFLCQGFPADYQIQFQMRVKVKGKWLKKWLTKKAQTRLVGNSVPPHIAAALVRANLPDLALRYAA